MAEFTNQELRLAREALKIPRWKLAADVNVSESTIERWETGETQPHPDEVDRVAAALGDPTIWHRWMLSNYDSYRKRYINGNNGLELPVALMSVRHELCDVLNLQDKIERDSVDGKIDDQRLKEAYTKEVKEALAALADSLQRLV
jgi:transcriptional regulator with XRE-family HTH domain